MVELSSPIVIHEQWSSSAAAIATASLSDRSSSPPVVFICGAKNSGKSTFSRLLLNSLVGRYSFPVIALNRVVVYLDTDVGQPEFTTPGCLSFHLIHGQNPGIGYHIMVEMLRYMEPTHVIQIRISVEEKNLPLGEFWLEGSQRSSVGLIDLYAAHSDSSNKSVLTKKSGRHSRDAPIIAYFRQCFPRKLEHHNK